MSTNAAPGPVPADVQQQINNEADARFWAQTGYHPGKKLDPTVAADRAFVPVWVKIHDQLADDWRAGRLTLTHQTAAVAGLLSEASSAASRVFGHVLAAFSAPTAAEAAKHMAAADDAHQRASAASSAAASRQPPSVSTQDVVQAATDAAGSVPVQAPARPGERLTPEQRQAATQAVVDLLNVVRAPTSAARVDGSTPAPATPATTAAPAPTTPATPDPTAAASALNNGPANAPVTSKTPLIAAGIVAAGIGLAFALSGGRSRGKGKRRRAARAPIPA